MKSRSNILKHFIHRPRVNRVGVFHEWWFGHIKVSWSPSHNQTVEYSSSRFTCFACNFAIEAIFYFLLLPPLVNFECMDSISLFVLFCIKFKWQPVFGWVRLTHFYIQCTNGNQDILHRAEECGVNDTFGQSNEKFKLQVHWWALGHSWPCHCFTVCPCMDHFW